MSLSRRLSRLREATASGLVAPPSPSPGRSGIGPEPAPVVVESTVLVPDEVPESEGASRPASPWSRSGPPAVGPERVSELRSQIEALLERHRAELRRRPPPAAPTPLPGERRETEAGPLHLVVQYLEPDHQHGRVPVRRALSTRAGAVAALALDPAIAAVDCGRLLFLDTETTGLSGGTGTLPFLIGLAFFEDGVLVVEQLLLARPGEEAPMLAHLAERVAAADAICTYNGKSFDWPLLRSRGIMARHPLPEPRAHLDLLHAARRVFGRRLGRVRLVDLEADVLRFRREGDIDGAEIPERYWAYVRGADASPLAPVLEHNANDLVALAALLPALAERFDDAGLVEHAPDRLGLAKVALRAEEPQRALGFAAAAAEDLDDPVAVEALRLSAEIHRRAGRHEAAQAALQDGLRRASAAEAPALHLALAKLYEHKLRQLELALVHAEAARPAEPEGAHARRIARLLRRLGADRPTVPALL